MSVIERKKQLAKSEISKKCGCKTGCAKCTPMRSFIDSMADANIPEAYWMLSYKNFAGSDHIKKSTEAYVEHIDDMYRGGQSICYAGSPGTGKTMSACTILKAALKSGYTSYYTSLSDIASYLADHTYKTTFYHKLINVDFLCIDEVDSRHFADTESSENFFGRSFERVFRYRVQNRLPILFATNHSSLNEAFTGQFKKIFESISSQSVKTIVSLGVDHRIKSRVAEK
jgi:DNA replication protein DnaC